ncbi:MAG: hypothetical protein DDT30_01925 [Dehalococcoidia bacterium]|nr:hypothetical protein [Bacillota bacterium]
MNNLGRPICLEGLEIVYNGLDEKRQRIKWRYPLHKEPDRCQKNRSVPLLLIVVSCTPNQAMIFEISTMRDENYSFPWQLRRQ